MLTQEGGIEDAAMKVYQAQVIKEYKGDWLRFFLEWKKRQEEQHSQVMDTQKQVVDSQGVIIKKLDKRAREAEMNEKALKEKYESLFQRFLEMQKQITFLHNQAEEAKEEQERKKVRKNQRKSAKKQEIRQTVTKEEFDDILKHCVKSNSNYVKARRRVALTLLYLTGLRVTNLLNLNAGQLDQLICTGHTTVALIKGGPQRHPIRLAYKGQQELKAIKHDIKRITTDKTHQQPVFTTQKNREEAITEHTLERELNKVLIEGSARAKKHIRTHSLRATLITELLKSEVSIHKVKEIVGHSNIGSTLLYDRNQMTVKEIDKIVSKRYNIAAEHKASEEEDE